MRNPSSPEPVSDMLASVIVCTYNRCLLLRRLLETLIGQTTRGGTFEVIVVDDGSTDGTAGVCQDIKARWPALVYLATGSNGGLSRAANLAVSQARGEYLLFTDDDCLPAPDWIERMCGYLAQHPIVAGAVLTPRTPYFKLCHNIAQFYPFMPGQKKTFLDFIAGANMGIRASVFGHIGFFQVNTPITDMEFILRARRFKYTIAYGAEAGVVHDPNRVTLPVVLSYAARHARETIGLRQQFHDVLRTPWVLSSPFLLALAAPLIASKVTLGIYLGNKNLLRFIHTLPVVFAIKLAWCWGAIAGLLKKKWPDHE